MSTTRQKQEMSYRVLHSAEGVRFWLKEVKIKSNNCACTVPEIRILHRGKWGKMNSVNDCLFGVLMTFTVWPRLLWSVTNIWFLNFQTTVYFRSLSSPTRKGQKRQKPIGDRCVPAALLTRPLSFIPSFRVPDFACIHDDDDDVQATHAIWSVHELIIALRLYRDMCC